MPKITTYNRESAFTELPSFDPSAKDGHFIEVTLWHNGEGFDVHISSPPSQSFLMAWGEFKALKNPSQSFLMTWGEFKALKKLIKELDK